MPVPPFQRILLFLGILVYPLQEVGKKPHAKEYRKRSPSRDQLTAALENQVRKQEATIRTQEKAIGLLTKHDNGLAAFLDPFFKA